MRHWPVLLAVLLCCPVPARAGAWTQAQGRWQVIAQFWASQAARAFDGVGDPHRPVRFHKMLFQTSAEYGWSDRLTLLLDTETATAAMAWPGEGGRRGLDNALALGARYRLTDRFGILSVEGSVKTAGAFNSSVSAGRGAVGRQAGIRLLYGTNFRLLERDGFADVEAAERFISPPRPDETPIDITLGLWLDRDWMAMVQSFNLISGGARPPYGYYRSHKLEVSVVRRLSDRFLVQAGGFFSPLGQNALAEKGLCLALWARF